MQIAPLRHLSLAGIAALVLVLIPQTPSQALVLLRVEQVGMDVVITGSGSANLTGLTPAGTRTDWTNNLRDIEVYAGPDAFLNGNVSLFTGITSGPLAFGSVDMTYELPAATGSSGDLFGILTDDGMGISQLVLPVGYVSGASLSGVSTFPDVTLSFLGLSAGQVNTWSWGSGATADSLRLEVTDTAPVPAPAPLLGALAAFRLARDLRRRLRA